MSTLLDIAATSETITIGGKAITCRGISGTELIGLMTRFPGLGELLWGRGASAQGNGELSPSRLAVEAPAAIAAILAAGTDADGMDIRTPADKQALEGAAARLSLQHQVELLAAILRCTLPDGLGPFMEKLAEIFGDVLAAERLQQIGLGAGHPARPNGAADPATI